MTIEGAKVAQKTKVQELKDIIEQMRSISIDIRDKTQELACSTPPPKSEDVEVASEHIGNVLINNLLGVRNILQEAYSALSAFV